MFELLRFQLKLYIISNLSWGMYVVVIDLFSFFLFPLLCHPQFLSNSYLNVEIWTLHVNHPFPLNLELWLNFSKYFVLLLIVSSENGILLVRKLIKLICTNNCFSLASIRMKDIIYSKLFIWFLWRVVTLNTKEIESSISCVLLCVIHQNCFRNVFPGSKAKLV